MCDVFIIEISVYLPVISVFSNYILILWLALLYVLVKSLFSKEFCAERRVKQIIHHLLYNFVTNKVSEWIKILCEAPILNKMDLSHIMFQVEKYMTCSMPTKYSFNHFIIPSFSPTIIL